VISARRGTFAKATASVLATLTMLVACNASFRFDDAALPAGTDGGGDESQVTDDATSTRCASDATCGDQHCDTAAGMCVPCLEDGDCSGSRRRCDPTAHLCVECQLTSDCRDREACNVTTHRCLDTCNDGDDPCANPGFVCDVTLHLCVECRSTANCAGSPTGAICDVPIGRCVQCTGNAQCPNATPACDRRSGRCVGCLTSAACGAGSGSVCDKTTLTCH
jgi:hypothetical protein